ncbi:MAG: aldo/keto reductase [Fibrobacterales bacterium]|nr:aldo/keto reductase [Fibrobacterales bacterium]
MSYEPATDRYEKIPFRRCGRSGVLLPEISLGLWHNFGGVDDPETAREIILGAFDRGICHFDLANNYGPPYGSAELTFGRALKTDLKPFRDELFISTKAGWDMWPGPYGDLGSRKYLLASLDQSLKRMGLEYVDVFYHHRPDPDTPMEESLGALATAVKQGKALYAGISSYDGEQTARAVEIMRGLGVPLLVNQVPYNLLNRRVETDLAPVLEREGVGCTVFSPLAQGILTGKYLDGIPEGSRCARPDGFLKKEWVTDEDRVRVRALKKIADRRGEPLAQLALNWILSHKWVSSILVGARSLEQLDQNLAALVRPRLTDAEHAEIDAAVGKAS